MTYLQIKVYKLWRLTKWQLLVRQPPQGRWTRRSRRSLIPKLQPSAEIVVAEEAVAVAAVDADAEEVVAEIRPPSHHQVSPRGPRTPIFLLESSNGVECIINTGKMHFSAVIHHLVHGKMFLLKNQRNNERSTNSAKIRNLTLYTQ